MNIQSARFQQGGVCLGSSCEGRAWAEESKERGVSFLSLWTTVGWVAYLSAGKRTFCALAEMRLPFLEAGFEMVSCKSRYYYDWYVKIGGKIPCCF